LELQLEHIGKKIQGHWLFKGIDLTLKSGQSLSITGKNGAGKSTLMQVVYGLTQASEGKILVDKNANFKPNELMAMSAPYLELPMEFSLREIHHLYLGLQKTNMPFETFVDFALFQNKDTDKPLKHFSSGMLQRLKTALCFASNSAIILLDEPLTNMDRQGELWYKNCLDSVKSKICIVAGNQDIEVNWTDINLKISED